MQNRIADVRKSKGIMAKYLAARSGLHPCTLSLIENGRRSPSRAQLRAIARVLRVPISHIWIGEVPTTRMRAGVGADLGGAAPGRPGSEE